MIKPALFALSAGMLAGCGLVSGSPAPTSAPDTAELFAPGVISNEQDQSRIAFEPDGRTAYFTISAGFFPVTRTATIYVSRFADGTWSTPAVAPFSGRYSDIDPHVTPDGRRLYFSSIRPVNGTIVGDVDIWMMERSGSGWGEPVRLGPEVNGPVDELYPSVSRDGTLYFASGPLRLEAGKHWDIYSAKPAGGGFAARQPIAAVNTAPSPARPGLQDAWEFNPEISADGNTLVFASLRPGGHGLGDIYVSRRSGDTWSPPRNLGPRVNTKADEYHPTLSPDGRALYFVRRGPNAGDFYRISASVLAP